MDSVVLSFLNYWRALGGGTQVPSRRSLDLRQLASVLPWMFIMEMASDGTLRFRLAGSSLESAMGVGMTDRNFDELFDTSADDGLGAEIYALSIVRGCGLLRCGSISFDGKNFQPFEVLALPFSDDRALGGTVMVAAVQPFTFENHGFTDMREEIRIRIDKMFMLPSPNIVKPEQVPVHLLEALSEQQIDLKVLDVERLMALITAGELPSGANMPSFSLESASQGIIEQLN